MSDCQHPSSLRLDALALDGVSVAERRELEAHLVSCARCQADSASAASLRKEFDETVYRQALRGVRSRMAPRRPWWRALVPASAALVVAVAAVLLVVRQPQSVVEPAYRVKGGPSLRVFGRRQEKIFAVSDGDRLHAGDQVRFTVANPAAGYLMIASVDGRGHGSIYFPFDGQASALVSGLGGELPGSVILDDAAGPERLFALWSPEPLTATTVLSSLETLGALGPAAIRAATSLPLPATSQRTTLIEKVSDGIR